jgi:hypothetical protein
VKSKNRKGLAQFKKTTRKDATPLTDYFCGYQFGCLEFDKEGPYFPIYKNGKRAGKSRVKGGGQ